jgi:DNA invertase Pin-like site-specific DNA recombinase
MLIGYARVSSKEQNLDLQTDALRKAGCERIFTDEISGLKKNRPGLDEALRQLRDNEDTFIVWKLDRLGRSVKGVITLIEDFEKRGIHFTSLTEGIETTTPAGRFFFHIMISLAQMERELLVERTKAGIAAARKRGKTPGRKRKMTSSKISMAIQSLRKGIPVKEVAESLHISVPTLYRWCPASNLEDINNQNKEDLNE